MLAQDPRKASIAQSFCLIVSGYVERNKCVGLEAKQDGVDSIWRSGHEVSGRGGTVDGRTRRALSAEGRMRTEVPSTRPERGTVKRGESVPEVGREKKLRILRSWNFCL